MSICEEKFCLNFFIQNMEIVEIKPILIKYTMQYNRYFMFHQESFNITAAEVMSPL